VDVLYHFSEDPSIARFVPRRPEARPEVEPLVWAVDDGHAWTYTFPRDCPRMLVWPIATTTPADRAIWPGERVACVEWAWYERIRAATLFRYRLPPDSFRPVEGEDHAWMFVSSEPVEALGVDRVGDLFGALAAMGVELRFLPSLALLRDAWRTTMHVSGIRLRNARGWPGG
jgi:hypothetical protein